MGLKLGKLPAKPQPLDFKLAEFLDTSVLPDRLPTHFGHGDLFRGDNWLMFGNGPDPTVHPGFNGAGCCVPTGIAHIIKMNAKLRGRPVPITGKEVIKCYSDITGYVLDDESTDNGTYMSEAMSYWRNEGFTDAVGQKHKIGAYISFNARDLLEHQQAVYVFGFTLIGFNFPKSAWSQFRDHQPWSITDPASPSDGGHCVPELGVARRDEITTVTWARRQEMNRDFLEARNDEAWAVVFPETLNVKGVNERGLDVTKLNDALASLH